MTHTVTIGGEDRTIAEFSAFKAGLVLELIDVAMEKVGNLGEQLADYEREYRERHADVIPRAEARRRYRPLPILDPRTEGTDDEQVLMHDGKPVLGEDPLAHISEADWEASGQVLRRPGSPPSKHEKVAHVFHLAMRAGAREDVQRLVTLALTPNGDLEKWDRDESADVLAKLDEEARELVHRVKGSTFWLEALVVAAELIEEDFGGTIRELGNRMGNVGRLLGVGSSEESEREGPPAMTVELADEPEPDASSPTGSDSEAVSDGPPAPLSTAATA